MVRNGAALGKGQGIGVAWRQIWGGLGLAFMGEVSDCAVLEANQCLAWCRGWSLIGMHLGDRSVIWGILRGNVNDWG